MKNQTDAQGPNLKQISEEKLHTEPEISMEQRAEKWGENLDQKISGLENRLPFAASALLDGLCAIFFLFLACWLMARIGWISLPAWKFFGTVYVLTFVISLIIRYMRLSPRE